MTTIVIIDSKSFFIWLTYYKYLIYLNLYNQNILNLNYFKNLTIFYYLNSLLFIKNNYNKLKKRTIYLSKINYFKKLNYLTKLNYIFFKNYKFLKKIKKNQLFLFYKLKNKKILTNKSFFPVIYMHFKFINYTRNVLFSKRAFLIENFIPSTAISFKKTPWTLKLNSKFKTKTRRLFKLKWKKLQTKINNVYYYKKLYYYNFFYFKKIKLTYYDYLTQIKIYKSKFNVNDLYKLVTLKPYAFLNNYKKFNKNLNTHWSQFNYNKFVILNKKFYTFNRKNIIRTLTYQNVNITSLNKMFFIKKKSLLNSLFYYTCFLNPSITLLKNSAKVNELRIKNHKNLIIKKARKLKFIDSFFYVNNNLTRNVLYKKKKKLRKYNFYMYYLYTHNVYKILQLIRYVNFYRTIRLTNRIRKLTYHVKNWNLYFLKTKNINKIRSILTLKHKNFTYLVVNKFKKYILNDFWKTKIKIKRNRMRFNFKKFKTNNTISKTLMTDIYRNLHSIRVNSIKYKKFLPSNTKLNRFVKNYKIYDWLFEFKNIQIYNKFKKYNKYTNINNRKYSYFLYNTNFHFFKINNQLNKSPIFKYIKFYTNHSNTFLLNLFGFLYISKKLNFNANINNIRKQVYSFAEQYDLQKRIIKNFFKTTSIKNIYSIYNLNQKIIPNVRSNLTKVETLNSNLNINSNSWFDVDNFTTFQLKSLLSLPTRMYYENIIGKNKNYKFLNFPHETSNMLNFTIKKIKFKPGYIRIWKTARMVLQQIMRTKFRYQHRLTTFLSRHVNFIKHKLMLLFEMNLINILIQSKILNNKNFVLEFINSKLIFINGVECTNAYFQLYINDFIQLIVHLKYYIIFKLILNYSIRLKLKSKIRILRKLKQFKIGVEKQKSNFFINWNQYELNTNNDVTKYLEIDLFTLSIFIIYEPFLVDDFNNYTFYNQKYSIMNLYNWKYIN
uniref:Ribosomal protein S4 n=1 Tax=Pseudourostyla cristata TaxID=293816 RepID=A0A4P9JLA8_9SPIT|nr:ribosomal protein S4 [Pseudourostyla cristata]